MKINSFQQAKARLQILTDGLKELGEFLNHADSIISAMNALKGPGNVPPPPPSRPANDVPSSMTDRVFHVLKQAGKPLKPVEALELYVETGWPRPEERRELYTQIIGCLNYLVKRKEVAIKTPDGYRVK